MSSSSERKKNDALKGLILLLIVLTQCAAEMNWWVLGMEGADVWQGVDLSDPDTRFRCKRILGLTPKQKKICKQQKDHMPVVSRGALMAMDECQHQFRFRRWNCSTVDVNSGFGAAIMSTGSREAAFTHAIFSAGVQYAIARACRNGELGNCGCGDNPRPIDLPDDYTWGGCGDNIIYSYNFTRVFVDSRDSSREIEPGSDMHARKLMDLHNNEAGRRILIQSASYRCKCHGVSGACNMQTCWKQMAEFRDIGDIAKQRYDGSTEMNLDEENRLRPADTRYTPPTIEDLVYIHQSPDYCTANPGVGSLGTSGRECNKESMGMDGCSLMCCGRGYNTYEIVLNERCHCKFHWCCAVKCKTCRTQKEINRCK